MITTTTLSSSVRALLVTSAAVAFSALVIIFAMLPSTNARAAGFSGSPDSAGATDVTPIIVAVGGFSTCVSSDSTPRDSDIYTPFRNFVLAMNARPGAKPAHWIAVCHTKSSYSMRFYSSLDPETLRSGNADDLTAEIEAIARVIGDKHAVYIIGHSYGGWATMLVSINLAPWVHVDHVVTIDPISAQNCSPIVFVAAYLGSMSSVNAAPGCITAPKDLKPWYSYISSRVKSWRNYYQMQYLYLHSDTMAGPSNNKMMEYNLPYLLEYRAHQVIGNDSRIWNELTNLFAR